MLDDGPTLDGTAQALGWSRQLVTARAKILKLSETGKQLFGTGEIPVNAIDLPTSCNRRGRRGPSRDVARSPLGSPPMRARIVRPATHEDAAAIAHVHVRSWQVAYRGLLPDAILDGLSVEQRRKTWVQMLENIDDASTLVAEGDAGLVGFCSMATPSRDDDAGEATCEVAAIYVSPSVWRVGIGDALLDAALRKVRQDGWREVTLWVFAANAGARAFYDGFGFAPDGSEMHDQSSGQTEIRLRASL